MLNKIHNIDCIDFMKTVPDGYFDLILTDPPYGMSFQSNYRKEKHNAIANDSSLDWLNDWSHELYRVFNKDGHGYVFCSWHFIDRFKMSLESTGFTIKNILVWHKNNTGMGDLYGDYAPHHELCIFISNGKRKLNGGRDSNILKARRTDNNLHPTQKPQDLFEYLIEKSAVKGSKVFDSFMGSGTTAAAAKARNIDWCGCELDSKYVEIANKRLQSTQTSMFAFMEEASC